MGLLFRQLFEPESSTYTYILADSESGKAILIDPVLETMERDLELLGQLKLDLKYILETHVHADHITSSGPLRERVGGQIGLGEKTGLATADILLKDGESVTFGNQKITAISTPGHTAGCTSYFIASYLFTGDTLLIRGCGRTDFQGGNSSTLFHSVREKLFRLPDETLIYPGHDYKGFTCSSIREEKEFNPRLKLENSEADFIQIMDNLKLEEPKKIKEAVPANLKSGLLS